MRILVIEDESKIAASVKKGLEQEGFAVDTALDGLSGYDLASSEPYDLIILDIMLPGIDGMALCARLREEDNKTPILMLTAKDTLEDKVTGLNEGADDYLTKPFAFEELLARINALLRRPNHMISKQLICGDLSIDLNTHEVKRGEKEISLSRKESALLEYLMRNKNHVVTKEQIIQHVWDFDSDVLPNTVEVYIGYLRNKIESDFSDRPKLIKTVRGFGYKIEEPKENV
jgi:DNA-binding response OmpR family regulator